MARKVLLGGKIPICDLPKDLSEPLTAEQMDCLMRNFAGRTIYVSPSGKNNPEDWKKDKEKYIKAEESR